MIYRAQAMAVDAIESLKRAFRKRPKTTEGQLDQERETSVSIGLMARAQSAGAAMTPEQQIFISQSEHGMRERLSVLLRIPHRSLAQDREKVAIEQWLATQADGPPLVRRDPQARPARFLGPLAANPVATILLSPISWCVALAAFALVQMGLKERIETQRDVARAAAQANRQAAERWQERAEEYRQGLEDAANVARHAAAALDAERARQAAAAARERRRNRAIQDVLSHSPEPPEWRLREPEPPAEGGSSTPGA